MSRTIANGLLLTGALLILLGTPLSLGAWLSARSFTLPLASLAAGVLLLGVAAALLRDARAACEVLLSALSLPFVLFGLGLLLQTLAGRSGRQPALALILLLAGAGGAIAARALLRRRRAR